MDLCFATNNKGKLEEIKVLLKGQYNILSLQDIGCHEELPETQPTIPGNSLQKAQYVWDHYQVNCFADDSGLEVTALNGEPGVYSARWAGPGCTPEDNITLLLKKLSGIENREANFLTCITLILNGKIKQFDGIVEGHISKERSGSKGFGYDPVFIPENKEVSFAEMTIEEKNAISHRGKAVRALVKYLRKAQS